MKTLTAILIIILYLCLLGSPIRSIAQSQVYEIEQDGETMLYRVILPLDYNSQKKYPLLLVPGMEKENDPYSIYIGENPARKDWIIVESLIYLKPQTFTSALIDKLKRDYSYKSLHFSGFSANSVDMFRLASVYYEEFASLIAMPGYANGIDADEIKRNPQLKFVFIVGEKDSYRKKQAVSAQKRLNSLGANTSLDIISGAGHVLKEIRGDPFFSILNKRLWK